MLSGVFQDAVESSAKVFGRKEVRVLFEGSDAKTDGDTVYLPTLPPSSEINVEQADIIRGFRDHESMHVRCTDTSPATLKLLADAAKTNPHLEKLIQYCEDTRIENAGIQEYPGMKVGLSATNAHAAKMLLKQIEERGDPTQVITSLPPALRFRLMLQSLARADIGVTSGGVFEQMNEIMRQHDPKLFDLARQYATKMTQLPTGIKGSKLDEDASRKGTAEAFKLANEIYAAFKDHEQDNPPPPPQGGSGDDDQDGEGDDQQQGQNSQPGDGEDGGSQADGDDQGDGSGQSGGDGSGNGQVQQGEEGNGGQQDGSSGGNSNQENDSNNVPEQGQAQPPTQGTSGAGGGHSDGGSTAPDVSDIDDHDLQKKALNDVINQISSQGTDKVGKTLRKGMFDVFSRRFMVKVPVLDAVTGAAGDGSTITKLRLEGSVMAAEIEGEISGKRAMIRRILELELQARNDRRWEAGHKHGRLQSIRVVDAMHGRETVYQRRNDGKDMDTLLHISIDGSGSMAGSRGKAAATLAMALSEALERTGCDIQVEMWGDKEYYGKGKKYTKDDVSKLGDRWHSDVVARRDAAAEHGAALTPKYVSLGVLTRAIIKSKRQRTSDPEVKVGFGLIRRSLRSGTPSYHAVFSELTDLAREQYAKKIYLHITDGDADYPIEGQKPTDLMAEAHVLADKAGVHMIGVGINGMRVSHLFRDSIEVSGSDAYEPVIRRLAKLIAMEGKGGTRFQRAA